MPVACPGGVLSVKVHAAVDMPLAYLGSEIIFSSSHRHSDCRTRLTQDTLSMHAIGGVALLLRNRHTKYGCNDLLLSSWCCDTASHENCSSMNFPYIAPPGYPKDAFVNGQLMPLCTQVELQAAFQSLSPQSKLHQAGPAQQIHPPLGGQPGQSQMRSQTLRETPCAPQTGAERLGSLMRQSPGQSLR